MSPASDHLSALHLCLYNPSVCPCWLFFLPIERKASIACWLPTFGLPSRDPHSNSLDFSESPFSWSLCPESADVPLFPSHTPPRRSPLPTAVRHPSAPTAQHRGPLPTPCSVSLWRLLCSQRRCSALLSIPLSTQMLCFSFLFLFLCEYILHNLCFALAFSA